MPSVSTHVLSTPVDLETLIAMVPEPVLESTGREDVRIESIAPISDARPGSLAFCKVGGVSGAALVAESDASVVIVGADFPVAESAHKCLLRVTNPARWFVRAMSALFPTDTDTFVHAEAVVEDGASIGTGSHIEAGAYIDGSVELGQNCRVGPNASLGVSGLAVEYDDDNLPLPYPHLGRVVIGDNVCIGANSVVVRGILESTRIGEYSQIGNMVNIGHNCTVGVNCWISTGAVLCGSASIGTGVMVGASATINNHVSIGDGATVGLGSVVTKSVMPGKRVFGVPAKPLATMRKL